MRQFTAPLMTRNSSHNSKLTKKNKTKQKYVPYVDQKGKLQRVHHGTRIDNLNLDGFNSHNKTRAHMTGRDCGGGLGCALHGLTASQSSRC